MTAHHVARNPLPGGDKRATATGSGRLSSVGYSRLTVNVLRLALVLTLLGGPQALHMGPQDPNFTENLVASAGIRSRGVRLGAAGKGQFRAPSGGRVAPRPATPHQHGPLCSPRQVDGNWFSIARASNEPKLLRTDSDTMFFIHKIHMTFKTTQFHVRRR